MPCQSRLSEMKDSTRYSDIGSVTRYHPCKPLRAGLWRQVEELDYDERKTVLKRVTAILEEFALQECLQRRNEPQSIFPLQPSCCQP